MSATHNPQLTTNMPLEQEQYEKLEAYVGGELDPSGRAEVEKQLAGNPQLRKLMAELAATRDMVRGLPRASAPADLLETFQGQIERAELFGDVGPDEKDVVLRISRWPQYMSVAAVIFLALGLAGIIYKVILPKNRANTGFVLGPSGDGGDDRSEEKNPATSRSRVLQSEKHEGLALGTISDPAKLSATLPSVAMRSDTRPHVSAEEIERARKGLTNGTSLAESAPEEPIVMVVRSDNPQAANAQVRSYFGANSITFDSTTEALARDMLRTRDAKDEALGQNYVEAKSTTTTESILTRQRNQSGETRAAMNQQEIAQNFEKQRRNGDVAAAPAPSQAPAQTTEPADQGRRAFGGSQRGAFANNDSAGNYAYNNAATSQVTQLSSQQGIGNNTSFRGVSNSTQPAAGTNGLDANLALAVNPTGGNASGGNVYRAMLTQRQLRELNTRLQSQANQWTEIRGGALSDAIEGNPLSSALKDSTFGEAERAKTTANSYKKEADAATQPGEPLTLSKAEDGLAVGKLTPSVDRAATTQPTSFHVAALLPTTVPTTRSLTDGMVDARAGRNEGEDRREVVIVVNEQPIGAAATANGGAATTQPAGAAPLPAQPTTGPVGK